MNPNTDPARVTERGLDVTGIPTAILEGGDGPPVVLLHGPGESAVNWRWTIPDLVTPRRVAGTTDRPDMRPNNRSS